MIGLSLKVGPMGALLVVASAAACAAPELVQGDAGSNIWPIYKRPGCLEPLRSILYTMIKL